MAVTPNIRKDDYDPLKDFVPMGRIANFPFVIAARDSFPAKTLDEFVAYVKARPDQVTFGHAGPGSGTQRRAADGRRALQGVAPAFADMLGGNVHMISGTPNEVQPHLDSGKVRLLGISAPQRSKRYPGVPAIAESIPGHAFLSADRAVCVPGHAAGGGRGVARAANNPQYQQRFDRTGADAAAQSPQDLAATIAADFKLMQELTARLKLKAP